MENVPTNWCESQQKCNFGIIWAVSGPTGSPTRQKKILWLEISNYDPLWKSVLF